jgi:hypothetical protein
MLAQCLWVPLLPGSAVGLVCKWVLNSMMLLVQKAGMSWLGSNTGWAPQPGVKCLCLLLLQLQILLLLLRVCIAGRNAAPAAVVNRSDRVCTRGHRHSRRHYAG